MLKQPDSRTYISCIHTGKWNYGLTGIYIYINRYRQTCKQADRQNYIQTCRETHGQSRQTAIQAGRQRHLFNYILRANDGYEITIETGISEVTDRITFTLAPPGYLVRRRVPFTTRSYVAPVGCLFSVLMAFRLKLSPPEH